MKSQWQFLTNLRSFGAFAHDIAIAFVAWNLSFLLRFAEPLFGILELYNLVIHCNTKFCFLAKFLNTESNRKK